MSIKSLYEIYQKMERDNVILSYKGLITADLLTSILNTMETKLDLVENSLKTRKKVYNILVECLQNLYHHNEFDDSIVKEFHRDKKMEKLFSNSSLLVVTNPEDGYEVQTGNYVSKEKGNELALKINNINTLNKQELRTLYKVILDKGKISDKGTAGLGLIDIARKSGNKLGYSFLPINDKYSFFCLNVKINK